MECPPPTKSEILLQKEHPGETQSRQQDLRLAEVWVAKTAQGAEADGAGARGAKQDSLTQ